MTAYFMSAIPWKDCPFKLYMVVATTEGPEGAQSVFKRFYQNDALNIIDCFEVPVIRADVFEELVKKSKSSDN